MFNKIYQKVIVDLNLEKILLFFYKCYLLIISLKNKLFFYLNFKTSFSSFHQDIWIIKNIFYNKKKLFFLDVGAFDGISNSNTILFEKYYNWKGVCIEPNKALLNKLKKFRKNSKIIISAISNLKKKKVKFFLHGQLSKISTNVKSKNLIEVKNLPLSNIQAKETNFLSIDCEGFEEEVVKSINFKKKIDCIIIERPNKITHNILIKNNFILIKRFLFDYLYLNKTLFKKNKNLTKIKYDPPPKRTF